MTSERILRDAMKSLALRKAPEIVSKLGSFFVDGPNDSGKAALRGHVEYLAELEARAAAEKDPVTQGLLRDLKDDAEIAFESALANLNLVKEWDNLEKRSAFMAVIKEAISEIGPIAVKTAMGLIL